MILLATLSLSACSSTRDSHSKKPLSPKERAVAYEELAVANLAEGDGTSAIIALKESEKYREANANTYYLYALAYHQKRELPLAETAAKKAVTLKPDFSMARNTLGRVLLEQGKYPEAETQLKQAAHDLVFQESFLAKTNLGILYYKRMNPSLAEKYLTDALSEGGDRVCMAAYYRGMIYLEQNRLDRALTDFERSSKKACARLGDAHLAKGQVLIRQKKFDQARAKMIEVQRLFPDTDTGDRAKQILREIP